MNETKLTIGLFGFGVVGEGIYQVLQQTPSLQAVIKKICIKDPRKKRDADLSLFTTDRDEILNDPEIDVVVELINDADDAYNIVTTALRKGKSVVSANKKMIADHLPQLLEMQKHFDTPLLYEAAVCGSIPIIRNLEEYFDNDLLQSVCGIVNGSTNYILTKMIDDKLDYRSALLQAQQLGFAETDPALDVEGTDAVNKLTILLCHAYGIVVDPQRLLHIGINRIHDNDTKYAEEKSFRLKLTAQAKKMSDGKVVAFVLPQFVTNESQLYNVKNEYNGVVLQSSFADKQFLYGKGAGRFPTSSAVLSDISALRFDYRYEYRKQKDNSSTSLSSSYYLRVYISFDDLQDIEMKDFEWIEEFHCNEKRQHVVAVIALRKLQSLTWAKSPAVSIIVCPDGIIEALSPDEIKRRSLKQVGTDSLNSTNEAIGQFIQYAATDKR
jgi:homoserine dehydrogenase